METGRRVDCRKLSGGEFGKGIGKRTLVKKEIQRDSGNRERND